MGEPPSLVVYCSDRVMLVELVLIIVGRGGFCGLVAEKDEKNFVVLTSANLILGSIADGDSLLFQCHPQLCTGSESCSHTGQ